MSSHHRLFEAKWKFKLAADKVITWILYPLFWCMEAEERHEWRRRMVNGKDEMRRE
ncbi:hypothetical protein LCGC14_1659970 [marine sediment metagenome]|uniref:Uncharacterized protein n=1 Tax=marine sediment metagenome TaxID=412755 RepID=A0A0F9KUL6_9ZZZZ